MSEATNKGPQSGGLNVSRGTVDTGGGDVIARDLRNNYLALVGDKSNANIVEVLHEELREKNRQIAVLQEKNTELNNQIGPLKVLYSMIEDTIKGNCVNMNEYIMYSHYFFIRKDLYQEFWNSIPKLQRASDNKDD
jgi:hypothetical protein